jgi:hypothetical protein
MSKRASESPLHTPLCQMFTNCSRDFTVCQQAPFAAHGKTLTQENIDLIHDTFFFSEDIKEVY